jgi:hypothetical protein
MLTKVNIRKITCASASWLVPSSDRFLSFAALILELIFACEKTTALIRTRVQMMTEMAASNLYNCFFSISHAASAHTLIQQECASIYLL